MFHFLTLLWLFSFSVLNIYLRVFLLRWCSVVQLSLYIPLKSQLRLSLLTDRTEPAADSERAQWSPIKAPSGFWLADHSLTEN